MINKDAVIFFENKPEELALYEEFEGKIQNVGKAEIKTGKTQITFSNRHVFACVSMMRLRKKKDMPKHYIVITFGLGRHEPSDRIDVATEPYPNRWTHHILIDKAEDMDDELMGWIREAYDFSASK